MASALYAAFSGTGDAMSGALDSPELLDVDVQQIARRFMLVSLDRLGRIQIAELGQPGSCQHPPDRTLGDTQVSRDPGLREALSAQLGDRQRGAGAIDLGLIVGREERSPNPASPAAR